jgi:hypothetical protein
MPLRGSETKATSHVLAGRRFKQRVSQQTESWPGDMVRDVPASSVDANYQLASEMRRLMSCSRASVEKAHGQREKFNKQGDSNHNSIQTTLLPSSFLGSSESIVIESSVQIYKKLQE